LSYIIQIYSCLLQKRFGGGSHVGLGREASLQNGAKMGYVHLDCVTNDRLCVALVALEFRL